ncbi:MAG: flagellar hook-associated protein FlgL [Solirubrobacterales bacterium]
MGGSLISIYSNVSYALNLHTRAITTLQEQTSSGNRINRGSDDPANAYQILGLNSQERSLDNYQAAIKDLVGDLEITTTLLDDMSSQMADIETLLTEIVAGIYNEEGQERIADEINNSLEQMVSLANTKQGSQYLFSGGNTSVVPYAITREDGLISAVTYQGSSSPRSINVASGVSVEAYFVGPSVFSASDRQDPIFLGQTGVAAGTGTSNVTGNVWLTVDYDGANYRVSIDDGATWTAVPSGGNANQAVTDSRTGQVLYLDTRGINAAGTELVQVPGTYDLFDSLISLRDMLLNDRGLTTTELLNYVNESATVLEEIENVLVQSQTSIGSQIGFLETLSSNLDDMAYDVESQTTSLQEADVAQISIDLSLREVLYQMSLSVAGDLMTMSLFDFLD